MSGASCVVSKAVDYPLAVPVSLKDVKLVDLFLHTESIIIMNFSNKHPYYIIVINELGSEV